MSKKIRGDQFTEVQLVKELKSCMRCKYFWGNNHRCANGVNGKIICRKNDIFLCHFPTYYFTIYNTDLIEYFYRKNNIQGGISYVFNYTKDL